MIPRPDRLLPHIEGHAAGRLAQRYGLAYTVELKVELFARIEAARANDNRHPLACRIKQYGHRERWLVSLDHRVLHVVTNRLLLTAVTFLPLRGSHVDPLERLHR